MASTSASWRAKLYRLLPDGNWDDRAVGDVELARDVNGAVLELVDSDSGECLHRHQVLPAAAYSQQQDKIISWTDVASAQELALSFQEPAGAQAVWRALQDAAAGVLPMQLHGGLASGVDDLDDSSSWPAAGLSDSNEAFSSFLAGMRQHDHLSTGDGSGVAGAGSAGLVPDVHARPLPRPNDGSLPNIFKTINAQALPPLEHEPCLFRNTQELAHAIACDNAQWLRELAVVFDAAEARNAQHVCEQVAKVMRSILLLGDQQLYNVLAEPDLFLFLAGALEYDLQSSAVSSTLHHLQARGAALDTLAPASPEPGPSPSAASSRPMTAAAAGAREGSTARGGSPGARTEEAPVANPDQVRPSSSSASVRGVATATEAAAISLASASGTLAAGPAQAGATPAASVNAASSQPVRLLRPRHRHFLCHCAQLKQVVPLREAAVADVQRVWRLQFMRDTLLPLHAGHPVGVALTKLVQEAYARVIRDLCTDAAWWTSMAEVMKQRRLRDVAGLAHARWVSHRRLRVVKSLLCIPGPLAAGSGASRSRASANALGHSPARNASPAEEASSTRITHSPVGGEAARLLPLSAISSGPSAQHSAGLRPRALSESSVTSLNSSTSDASFCSLWGEAAPWALAPAEGYGSSSARASTPPLPGLGNGSSAPWLLHSSSVGSLASSGPSGPAHAGSSHADRLLARTARTLSPHSPLYPLRQGNVDMMPPLALGALLARSNSADTAPGAHLGSQMPSAGATSSSSVSASPARPGAVMRCDSAQSDTGGKVLPIVPAPSPASRSPRDAIMMLLEMCNAAWQCDHGRREVGLDHSLSSFLLREATAHCPQFLELLEPYIGDRLADVAEVQAALEVLEFVLRVDSSLVLDHVEMQHSIASRVPPAPACSPLPEGAGASGRGRSHSKDSIGSNSETGAAASGAPPDTPGTNSSRGGSSSGAQSTVTDSTRLFIAAADGLHKLSIVAGEHGSLVPLLDDDVLAYMQQSSAQSGAAQGSATRSGSVQGTGPAAAGNSASTTDGAHAECCSVHSAGPPEHPVLCASPATGALSPALADDDGNTRSGPGLAPDRHLRAQKQRALLISLGVRKPDASLEQLLGASELRGCGFLSAPLLYRIVWRLVDDPHADVQAHACNILRRLCEANQQTGSESFKAILYDTYIPWLVRPFTHSHLAPLPAPPSSEFLASLASELPTRRQSDTASATGSASNEFVAPAPVGARRRRTPGNSSMVGAPSQRMRLDEAGTADRRAAPGAFTESASTSTPNASASQPGAAVASSLSLGAVGGETFASKISKVRIVELLCDCVRMHSYRAKHAIVRHALLMRVSRLLHYTDKSVALAGLSLLRTCVGTRDELYARLLLRSGELARVLWLWLQQRHSPSMLQSSVLELLQYVLADESKLLLQELANKYRAVLLTVGVEDTGARILAKAQELQEDGSASSSQLLADSTQAQQSGSSHELGEVLPAGADMDVGGLFNEVGPEPAAPIETRARSRSEDDDEAWMASEEPGPSATPGTSPQARPTNSGSAADAIDSVPEPHVSSLQADEQEPSVVQTDTMQLHSGSTGALQSPSNGPGDSMEAGFLDPAGFARRNAQSQGASSSRLGTPKLGAVRAGKPKISFKSL